MPRPARDYQPGKRVPGTVYEVVRLIGAGGMGTVYDVEDTTIGKRYVLKTLHPQLGEREDLARRMQSEARVLARLNHPNIVEVITAGVTGDDLRLPYYVMERLNGQSLRVVLEKKGRLELPHAYHIGIDLLDALHHAHDEGVIHRDVKPDNIFLHRTSACVTVTKLLDFGIVSLLDATLRETAGRFLGTLRYSAPEQLRGEKATPKVDVYAAGLVLYEIIAGRGPFDDEGDPHAIGAAHMDKAPPPLALHVAVPPDLEELVMAALSKAPEDRPRDAFSFAARLRDLKRCLSGSSPRESTEDRATAAAVIDPETPMAQYVDVRSSPGGAYVISPVRARVLAGQTSLPTTTLHGVARPTIGPSLADPVTFAQTATTPEVVDRRAPTNSYMPDTVASPQHGTEVLPFVANGAPPADPSPAPPSSARPGAAGNSSFQWPNERDAATSEEPHVQTLSVTFPRSSRWAARIVGLAAMSGVVTVVGVLVFARRTFSPSMGARAAPVQTQMAPAASASARPVASVIASAMPSPEPAPLESKPMRLDHVAAGAAALRSAAQGRGRSPDDGSLIAPARGRSLDDAAAAGVTAKSGSAPATAAPHGKTRPVGSVMAKPPAPPLRTDRPGPGF
jgi:serine/threonine protein kinase